VSASGRQPQLGFVGVHAGRHADRPVSQNETIAALFASIGYRARRASAVRRPVLRTLHQALAVLRWSRSVDLVVLAVFSGRSFWFADMTSFLCRATKQKVVLVLHGGRLPEFAQEHPARVRRVFERADLIVAPSDFLGRTFREWGFEVTCIPNVLAIERYPYRFRESARPALLWMRTFHEHYDPQLAIEVLAIVRRSHPETTLTMGGADYGLLDEVKALAQERGVADAVDFAGYLDATAKAKAFADHDVFLNTNRVDNMPVSVLEAAASGLVPVATAAGGIPDLLTDGVDSRLVPPGDAEAMAAAVCSLLDHPEEYARLGRGARELAEQSAWPSVHRRWTLELQRLLPDLVLP
jgi:glycosyltransferase involved in cell wall biosynthesis